MRVTLDQWLTDVPQAMSGSETTINRLFPHPARAPCTGGYLIGWVIDPASDTPIKFYGLIGDAVVRISGTALAGYNAIPIQADPSLANGAAVSTNGNGALMFDGAPGHYQAVTGQ